MARLSKYEQETIINFNEAENTANIYTCKKSLMNKLFKAKWAKFIRSEELDEKIYSMEFEVPKKFIKITPRKKYRKPSQAQLEALAKGRAKKLAQESILR
ncbi:MAG: immunoglobulin [Actinomycetota bacterium]